MKLANASLAVALAATVLTAGPAAAGPAADEPCVVANGDCRGHYEVADGLTIPYYSSFPLTGSRTPTHAVIVLHGGGGNYTEVFGSIVTAAKLEGPPTLSSTLIVSPRFTNEDQVADDDEAYWKRVTWKQGDGAVRPEGLSAFSVMDDLVRTVTDPSRFPHVRSLTLVGHSSGAQFFLRWAAGSAVPAALSELEVRVVVANPAAYLYLNAYRPNLADPSGTTFVVPRTKCAYNDYKYGLGALSQHTYLGYIDASTMRSRFAARRIYYLLGELDTLMEGLDVGCESMLQGENRFIRGTLYYAWVRKFFPRAPHAFLAVPEVGHDNTKMYPSAQGRAAIFPDSDG